MPRGKPFEKGHPGGPGRPKGSGRNEFCRKWAEKHGLAFLARVAEGKEMERGRPVDVKTRVDAAKYLIDHGLGKAPQAVEHSGGEMPVEFTLAIAPLPGRDGD